MEAFPQQIGPYVPERLLGRGAMAAVYLCRQSDGGPVAVKWLDDAHQALIERFDRECRSLSDVSHPGIVGYRAHGSHAGRPYLAMEYVEGTELRVYLDKLHRRPPAERYGRCRAIGVALCGALDHLHGSGLVHRDVKPTNVLIADDGRVLLSDLGIVQRDGDAEPSHGTLVGTPAYAAPEQAMGGRVDPRADLFGLGATLYHVLAHRRPFDGIDGRDALPPRPGRFDPGIPADLEAVLMRLLAPDPAHRYHSAKEVAEALSTGRDEGVRVAGRQDAVAAAARALQLAEDGAKVWIVPEGPKGGGRGWLARMVSRSARRQGVPVVVIDAPEGGAKALALLGGQGGAIVVANWSDTPVPASVETVAVPLQPLGAADVRRTVVGFAPRTEEAAQVAARLHRLSGGLPALLVPLLQAHTIEKAVELPETVPVPPIARRAMDALGTDARAVAATLAILDRPASEALLVAVVGPGAFAAVEELEQQGVATRFEGHVVLSAGVFLSAALAVHPDIEALRARVSAARHDDPTVPGATLSALCQEAERQLREGQLRAALDSAERASELSTAVGDQRLECHARATWGQVLLETGSPRQARRCLADATALARAVGDRALRHRTHMLRSWAEMDERPGDPGAAAAALDRLMPLVSALPDDLADRTGAFSCALWARAAATLRDRGAWRRAAESAEPRVRNQPRETQARLRLLLAEGALAIHDKSAGDRITLARDTSDGFPLHAWWAACLEARANRQSLPEAGHLTRHLSPNQTAALLKRGRQVGR